MPVVNQKYVTLPLTGLSNLAQFQLDNKSTNSLKHLVKKVSDLFYLDTSPESEGGGSVHHGKELFSWRNTWKF